MKTKPMPKSVPPTRKAQTADAVEETLRLYHAWLAVLLRRLDTHELTVDAQEIRDAIGQLKCAVSKEGDCYVIRMGDGSADDKEDAYAHQG